MDVTITGLAHASLLVNSQYTISPFTKFGSEITVRPEPIGLLFKYHCNSGLDPPLLKVAVNSAVSPKQTVAEFP
ncbi:MAG: hypothetical protein IPI10_13840 [Bacteroidetes bacterium]|nr:hypothetical protein [Bacteroidota bacterium]